MSRQFLAVDISNVTTSRRCMPLMGSPVKEAVKYHCKSCRARIALKSNVVSTEFRGESGKAILANEAKNVSLAPLTLLLMDSGTYRVQNSSCSGCDTVIGWKFVSATEEEEKWKEGHFILELENLEEGFSPLSPLDPATLEARWIRALQVAQANYNPPNSSASPCRTRPTGPRARITVEAC